MSQKQLSRYVTISRLIEKQMTVRQAATSLGLSTRQILRLKKGVRECGIKSPKRRRRLRTHRRRERKLAEGLLVQLDASPFGWLEDSQEYHLHGAIDDASGQVVGLYLAQSECLEGYFQTIHLMLELYGIPVSLYSDSHTIFFSLKKDRLSLEDQLAGKRVNLTQFGRAMSQLGIHMIPARTPQAKGRIERLWQTLQSRLTVELKCQGIKTVPEANCFLWEYMAKFNDRFKVETEQMSAFRPVPEGMCIDHILCVIQKRSYSRGGVFSFYHKQFQILEDKDLPRLPPKGSIQVLVSPHFGLKVAYADVRRTVSLENSQMKQLVALL